MTSVQASLSIRSPSTERNKQKSVPQDTNQKESPTFRCMQFYNRLLYWFWSFFEDISVAVGDRLLQQMNSSSYLVCQLLYTKLKKPQNKQNLKTKNGANPESENINLMDNIFFFHPSGNFHLPEEQKKWNFFKEFKIFHKS